MAANDANKILVEALAGQIGRGSVEKRVRFAVGVFNTLTAIGNVHLGMHLPAAGTPEIQSAPSAFLEFHLYSDEGGYFVPCV